MGIQEKALQYFKKFQQMIPNHGEAIFQMASMYILIFLILKVFLIFSQRNEEMGNFKEAEEKYKMLITQVPSDPIVLQRLGAIFAKSEDDILAHQYYMEVNQIP